MEHNDTSNGTLFVDSTFDDGFDTIVETSLMYFYAIYELIKFLLSLFALICDIFLIIVIRRFKKLHNRINKFILVYAVLNILFLILANVMYLIVEVSMSHYHVELFCAIGNLDHLLVTLIFYALTVLAIDWYVANYHPDTYSKYPKLFKYGLGIASIVWAVPKWFSTSIICFDHVQYALTLRFILESLSYSMCSIVLISIAISMKVRTPATDTYKTKYAFWVAVIPFLLSLPVYVIRVISVSLGDNLSIKYLIFIFEWIGELFYVSQTIVIFFMLGRLNKYFKTAYLKSCKRNVREYDDDDLDRDSVDERPENNVTFDKNSEVIRF